MAGNVMMTIRKEPEDEGLDDFFTQPHATRALLEHVKIASGDVERTAWEPACGGGHVSQVLRDEGIDVLSTDVFDYGYAGFDGEWDFLSSEKPDFSPDVDWIVTNPPYQRDGVEKFVHRALEYTPNVAVLARLTWLEGMGRCERLFTVKPPSLVLVLSERLGFERGTCVIGKKGMIPYAWYVWEEGVEGTRVEWILPGTASRLTRPDDVERFGRSVVVP